MNPEATNKNRTRRLRKKLRVGEFAEMGCHIDIRLSSTEAWDQTLDHLITFVEHRQMAFGGGGDEKTIRGFVTKMGRGTLTETDRSDMLTWLENQPHFEAFKVSPLLDAQYPETWPEEWQ